MSKIAIDCYTTMNQCASCAKNKALLKKQRKRRHLFPAHGPLEFLAIDILGPFLKTPVGNLFVLMITNRDSKLAKKVPLRRIRAQTCSSGILHPLGSEL